MQRRIRRLDLMIAYSCNIQCTGCISLSDFKRDGVAKYQDIEEWVLHWSSLVDPEVVVLFGGEPMLHPRILDICKLVRKHWPTSTIRLITNGYLLDKVDAASWFDYSPFEMQVSIHRADHESLINANIKNILLQRTDWTVTKCNNEQHHEKMSWNVADFRIYKSWFKDFIVPFKGKITPWMSDPKEAHSICGSPDSPILYKGKLYKCPAIANALDLSNQNWFDYKPCESTDTLDEFISNIGVPEPACGQCPNKANAVVINHFDKNNVITKIKNIS